MIQDILETRATTHGDFEDNATVSQLIKDAMHSSRNWGKLSAVQREGLEQIATKISRLLSGDHTYLDNPVDIQGFARLIQIHMEKLHYDDNA